MAVGRGTVQAFYRYRNDGTEILNPKETITTMSYQKYQECIDACLECAMQCEQCATACLQEDNIKMMLKCIQLDRDCADICINTARLLARGSEHGVHLMRECAEVCEKCAEECEKYDYIDHCKMCAEACRRCAEECRSMSGQLA